MKKNCRKLNSKFDVRRPQVSAVPSARVTAVAAAVLTALYGTHVTAATTADTASDEGSLEEVVVTASRRAVSAQDLPISITAVSGDALDKAHIEDIAGLANSMAGINYVDRGPFGGVNGSQLIIRGLNSESLAFQEGLATQVVPPVATYIDDTPLYFNMRLDDLDRVEVLRGPQGTLYGSGSLGGTIKFVLNAPDPTGFDAKGEVGVSKTQHTENLNEEIKGMINLPISDVFAIRLNAGASDDAGFVNQTNLYVLDAQGVPVLSQPTTAANPVGLGVAPQTYSKEGAMAGFPRSTSRTMNSKCSCPTSFSAPPRTASPTSRRARWLIRNRSLRRISICPKDSSRRSRTLRIF
jgi:outer membrane receptor protein involved in Fe transport